MLKKKRFCIMIIKNSLRVTIMKNEIRHLTKEQLEIIEVSVKNILSALGENPEREGLVETPERVALMYDEVFEGMRYTNKEIAAEFGKCFEVPSVQDMIVVKDIETFSFCEHHMALMYNMRVSVAYMPKGKVIGLSKIPRVVDLVCKRLQLQEKIGTDIAETLSMILETEDVIVAISGEHSCLTARGIRKPGAVTQTITARGVFKTDSNHRREFLQMIK